MGRGEPGECGQSLVLFFTSLPVSPVFLLLLSLLCPVCTGNADDLQQPPSQSASSDPVFTPQTPCSHSTLGSLCLPIEDGMQNEALFALLLSLCAVVVLSCFWYRCHIKDAK